MSWTEAAAIPLVYSTVYGCLVEAGKLPFEPTPEERGKRSVLILGGSSGTGNVAIQLAKKMGLRVVTTCSEKNRDFVTSLCADEVRLKIYDARILARGSLLIQVLQVIDYRTENVVDRVLHSHHAPYAVILDCVGGTDLFPHLEHLILDDPEAPHLGHYLTIVGDSKPRLS